MSQKVWVVIDTSDNNKVRVAGVCATKKRAKDLAEGHDFRVWIENVDVSDPEEADPIEVCFVEI